MNLVPILRCLRCICVFSVLVVIFGSTRADYPPNEIDYRLHPIEQFPKEATHSRFCQSRPDGNYPHSELDLGDPRCSFVMCTNRRTVITSCPAGTRTGLFYLPRYNPGIFYKARKSGKYAKYGRSLEASFREDFRNHKSTHGICDYFDVGGVCGSLYPDFNAFMHEEKRKRHIN